MNRISWKSTSGLALAAMVCLMAAPASAEIVYNVTNYALGQNGWTVNGTITVSGVGTFTNASAITAWDVTLSKPAAGSYQFTNALAGHDAIYMSGSTLTATTGKLDLASTGFSGFQFGDTSQNIDNMLSWIKVFSFDYAGKINGSFVFNSPTYSPDNNGVLTIGTATPSAVPEIDPAMGSSALSLVAGVLAMIEQRRRRAMLVA
jgi:hypothetical protein